MACCFRKTDEMALLELLESDVEQSGEYGRYQYNYRNSGMKNSAMRVVLKLVGGY